MIKNYIHYFITCILIFSLFLLWTPSSAQEEGDEETYSISLVQTAEVEREIQEIGDKKILTESYSVDKGDHLWQILRERGLLEKKNFIEILEMLRKINPSLKDLDLIHPGEKIIIPLVITPIGAPTVLAKEIPPPVPVPIETIKDLEVENYTIKRGDSLIKIINRLYDIPENELFYEYIDLLKKMNPSIEDINNVYPGQKIRLPIYSPKVVRLPIKRPPDETGIEGETERERLKIIGKKIGEIFSFMGEEWVKTGKHFIPLKTGGQINLDADSYPIIDLRNGNRVILDLYNDLPEKMSSLITSSWGEYRVFHFKKDDTLRDALGRLFPLCGYYKIFDKGEPLIINGDISMRITSDWIIKLSEGSTGNEDSILINLERTKSSVIEESIKNYLKKMGIKILEYPPVSEKKGPPVEEIDTLTTGPSMPSLIESILKLVGRSFSTDVEIPVYKGNKTGFDLIIKADYLIDMEGEGYIIDLSGLGPDIITLLKDRRFSVISISEKESPFDIVTGVLRFLDWEFDSKIHSFISTDKPESNNIRISITGIIFHDHDNQIIFATHLQLPPEIIKFISDKGFKVLLISPLRLT